VSGEKQREIAGGVKVGGFREVGAALRFKITIRVSDLLQSPPAARLERKVALPHQRKPTLHLNGERL
jgi:hypothetical protein